MVIRLVAFFDTLKTGQFPVRFLWNLNHGFGYPVTNFLYPLPFYFGSVIHLIGFGFIDSIKILFTFSFILSAFFMYKLVMGEFNRWAGIAAAVFYCYAPYRIFDVYTRGSLGETFAFIWPPLIFYWLNNKKYVFAALATAALICSHNVVAFLFLPVIIGYLIVKKTNFVSCFLYLGLSAGTAAWFWLPALYDLQYTRAAMTAVSNYSDYFLNFNLLGILISLVISTTLIRIIVVKKFETSYLVIVSFIALFFTMPISSFAWDILPLPKLVQFPWRFLSVLIFTSSVLLGSLISNKKYFLIFLIALFLTTKITVDKIYYEDNYYVANDDTTTVKNEYMPRWVKVDPTARPLTNSAVYFPGINPENYDANGIVTEDKISFSETPPRLAADIVSIVSLLLCALLLFL